MNVGELMDEVRGSWLEPPDELWSATALTDDIDDTQTTIPVDLSLLSVEEQDQLGGGVLVEVGQETMAAVSLSDSTLTVSRGTRGSVRSAHSDGAELRIAPPWTRKQLFTTTARSIYSQHPPLFATGNTEAEVLGNGIVHVPSNATTVTEVLQKSNLAERPFTDLGDWPDSPTGRAIQVSGAPFGSTVVVRFEGRFTLATTEADTLESLGFRSEWSQIVSADVASQMIAGRQLSSEQQNFLTQQLRLEGYQPTVRGNIRDSLIAMREYLVARAAADLARSYTPSVVIQHAI